MFQHLCSSICDSANICVRICVAASVFAFVLQRLCSLICSLLCCSICVRICVAASVFAVFICVAASVFQQHLCSLLCSSICVPVSASPTFVFQHLCSSICVSAFVFQRLQRLLCVLHKQSIAINDNLNHLLQSTLTICVSLLLYPYLQQLAYFSFSHYFCTCIFHSVNPKLCKIQIKNPNFFIFIIHLIKNYYKRVKGFQNTYHG
jgi:hypothetical protein